MLTLTPLLLAFASLSPALEDKPDLIVLAKGKQIECRILFEDDERVVYKAGRKVKELAMGEVAEVQSIERSMRTFLERYGALDATNTTALSELARWAESHDLHGEARNLWIRVLLLDGENEEAWTELGGSNGRRGWRLRVRGRYYSLEQLRERVGEWKTALELPTAHYLIKTNIDPGQALDISIDIEQLHQLYYDTIGQAMELYPFDEVPELHIWGDVEDAPNPPRPGWSSWYERVGNAVLVRGLEADRYQVRQNIVDLLITNSFRMAQGNRDGALPGWAREGISNAFAMALRKEGRTLELEKGVPYEPWFEAQLDDGEKITLKGLLDGGRGAFKSGPREDAYVHRAYTLVFFMVHASEGKYRELFVEYLRSAFDGKGAATHMEKIFGMELEQLDAEWQAYVRRVAGR